MRCGRGALLLAVVVTMVSRLALAADDVVAQRELMMRALAGSNPRHRDDVLWFDRLRFVARMIDHVPDGKLSPRPAAGGQAPKATPIAGEIAEIERVWPLHAEPPQRLAEEHWRWYADSCDDAIRGGYFHYEEQGLRHARKLLWEQALIAEVFLDAVQVTGEDRYRRAARDTLDFVLRDLRLKDGGFAAADLIADPDKRQSAVAYHAWTTEQISDVLTAHLGKDGALASKLLPHRFGEEALGIVPQPPGGVPAPACGLTESAAAYGLSKESAVDLIARSRAALLAVEDNRARPPRDERLAAAGNWLLVAALARAYAVLGDEGYREAAVATAEFLRGRNSTLEDVVAAVAGELALYQAAGEPRWLAFAVAHQQLLDREALLAVGGRERGEQIRWLAGIVRFNLLRLAEITGDDQYRERAQSLMALAIERLADEPQSQPELLCALDQSLGPVPHLLLVGDQSTTAGIRALLAAANRSYQPRLVIVTMTGEAEQAGLRARFPAMIPSPMVGGKATAYLCVGLTCNRPTTDPAELERLLAAVNYRW